MGKKKKIDFVISEDELSKTIFRFYPRQSSCHGFGDKPPKDWSGVYKVYYSYKIIKIWKDDNDHMILFDSGTDECSIIDEVANCIKLIADGEESYRYTDKEGNKCSIDLLGREMLPFGDGISWTIHKTTNKQQYLISMFNSFGIGYRFVLDREKLAEFGEYLNGCCEHMLANGEPI